MKRFLVFGLCLASGLAAPYKEQDQDSYEQQQQQQYEPQRRYDQQQRLERQRRYDQQQQYEPLQGYDQQQQYEPQRRYDQQQQYEPQRRYDQQQQYEAQQGYDQQQQYEPQRRYHQQLQYEPQQRYDQQQQQIDQEQDQDRDDEQPLRYVPSNPLSTSVDLLAKELNYLSLKYGGQGVLKVSYSPPIIQRAENSPVHDLGQLKLKYFSPYAYRALNEQESTLYAKNKRNQQNRYLTQQNLNRVHHLEAQNRPHELHYHYDSHPSNYGNGYELSRLLDLRQRDDDDDEEDEQKKR